MSISQDGNRPRYYAERKKVEAQQGNPIHDGVTVDTRRRIIREVESRSLFRGANGNAHDYKPWLIQDLNRVFGQTRSGAQRFHVGLLDVEAAKSSLDEFLQILEICAVRIVQHRPTYLEDLEFIQSLLADDLSAFRLVNVGSPKAARFQVQHIDNKHLHTVITDRTFELTAVPEFASAQNDYADAWKHYSKGDTDDAVANAGKAVESACKVVIKSLDPNSTPENENLGPLVGILKAQGVFAPELTHVTNQLEQIYRGSGTIRNKAGAAHGSLDPTGPEASTALLALRLSGTLIAFLVERWKQLKP